MDAYAAISARKTIRDFAPREIAPGTLTRIITAGMQAPSNNHMREWHFVVLQDKSRRKELLDQAIHPTGTKGAIGIINRWGLTDEIQRNCYIDAIPKQYNMLYTAGALIYPCYLQPGNLLKPKNLSALNNFASIWCCIENMLIVDASEGIFGVTRIPMGDEINLIHEFLNIPAEYVFPCQLALGYPAEDAQRVPQVDVRVEERIHVDCW
jgi:nitroreductase